MGPLYVFALCVFLFNSSLVALAVSVERRVSAFLVWKKQFLWLSESYFASAAIDSRVTNVDGTAPVR